ncbi:hypothetical protein BC826DRAFT_165704 [Russula brevipes]|nr:hypothetical protein BC826DRAFT_165704 [Russula brevipes]
MSVLATLTLLFLFPGFTIAPIVAPSCTASSGWNWIYNTRNQNPCTVAAYLGGRCNQGSFTVRPVQLGYTYSASGGLTGDSLYCTCNTVMYSLLSACAGCQGAIWESWSWYSSNCTKRSVSWFPYDVPIGTSVPQWALVDVTAAFEGDWNADKSRAVGDYPEIPAGAFITTSATVSTSTSLHRPTSTSLYRPTSTPLYQPNSTGDTTSSTKKKTNGGAVAGGVVAGVTCIGIAGAVYIYCRRQSRVRGPPGSSTVNADSQPLSRESAVSGASQAQSGESPVNGGSSTSHNGSRGMGGMQVSSVGNPGFIGGFQAASIVSPINATSQEPLASPESASVVHSPSQPHMVEDRQPVADNVTNPTSLEAGSLPTLTTTDTPNFPTEASESSRGAPVMPSVPSQLPTSFYRENAKASANMETWRPGEYHGLPMV